MYKAKLDCPRALVMSAPLEVAPRMKYVDGQRTDEQEKNSSGLPVWTIRGLAPVVSLGGGREAVDADATVMVASHGAPMLPEVEAGESMDVSGEYLVTRAEFGQVSGRFTMKEIQNA
jgi:hypothetical protein